MENIVIGCGHTASTLTPGDIRDVLCELVKQIGTDELTRMIDLAVADAHPIIEPGFYMLLISPHDSIAVGPFTDAKCLIFYEGHDHDGDFNVLNAIELADNMLQYGIIPIEAPQ